MGYSLAQAAQALGLSVSRVKSFRYGHEYGTGKPARPGVAVRLAMRALSYGLKPWPADDHEPPSDAPAS